MKTNQSKLTFQTNLESMSNKRIESMTILDSENYIRFLQDPKTGFYVVFDGRFNSSFYARSYKAAERKFWYLVTLRDSQTLRILDNWILVKRSGQYIVLNPNGARNYFQTKSSAEKFMLLGFYKSKDQTRR